MSDNPSTSPATGSEEELPQWARDKITAANNEAAKYRVKAREAADEAKAEAAAAFAAQMQALSGEKSATETERDVAVSALTKLRIALAAGVPGDSAEAFARLLHGSTVDEITAHAQEVKGLLNITQPSADALDPSQGHWSEPDPRGGDDFFVNYAFND